MTLPLPLRNRLAELVLEAFHDHAARRELEALAADGSEEPHTAELAERAERARRLFAGRPLDPADAPLEMALGQAALLFDGRLYFEVHELLEPYWLRAAGRERETLQGLIQVAVGFHHLGNGNGAGARALLHDGAAKLLGSRDRRDCRRRVRAGGGLGIGRRDPARRGRAGALSVVLGAPLSLGSGLRATEAPGQGRSRVLACKDITS